MRKSMNGDIKKIFSLSWPVMVGMILQSFLSTVDTYFISNLGTSEASASSLGNSASSVIFVISTIVSAGTIALVSRSYGDGDMAGVKRFSGESIMLSFIIGLILSILCYCYTGEIIKLAFNPKPTEAFLAEEYLSVIFSGTVFVFLNSAVRTVLHALGDTKTPLIVFGISNVINAILDPIFMFPLGFGIRGAAIATVLSMIFSFLIISVILIKKIYASSIKDFIGNMLLNMNDSIRILKIGGWACLQQIARPITGMLMFSLVYEVGNREGTAAFGIGGQLFNYTFIILAGLSTAISIMVGQSLGRGDIDECDSIIKEGLKLSAINMAVFAIPYMVLPAEMMGIFITDPLVIKHGVEYLRIVYIGIIFVMFTTTYGGAFQGAGDTFPPMISSLITNVILKLPLAYVLAKYFCMGTIGVWIAVALSVVIEAGIITFYFKKGRWKEKVI